MKSDRVARGDDRTGDDVVSIKQRSSDWFTNTVDVNGGSANEGDNKANCSGEEGWDHKNTEPTYIKAVVSGSYPLTKIIPNVSLGA